MGKVIIKDLGYYTASGSYDIKKNVMKQLKDKKTNRIREGLQYYSR